MDAQARKDLLQGIGKASALKLLKTILLIRHFEERAAELYTEEKIRGFLHLYIGEEAIATGAMSVLQPDDAIVATYREHGHALARGIAPEAVMAEMFGKLEGCSRGRGGSMHLFDAKTNFYGGNAIVAGGLPLAVGLALAYKMQEQKKIAACIFGEGAIAEGEFHESMNLAALWRLPVLFLCENNYYAMGTALSRSESQTDLIKKADSYQVAAESIDGMDICEVIAAVGRARTAILQTSRPYFVECRTYRYRAHSMFDPDLYRDKAEIAERKKHGPTTTFTNLLREMSWLDEAQFQDLDRESQAQVAGAVQFAEAGTWEALENLTNDVYTPRG